MIFFVCGGAGCKVTQQRFCRATPHGLSVYAARKIGWEMDGWVWLCPVCAALRAQVAEQVASRVTKIKARAVEAPPSRRSEAKSPAVERRRRRLV